MASKAPDAFRTISEVSDILETPPHVLRFWESKFTELKPVKRAGGRRYYRPSDLELLGGIKRLLHDDGMTIRGVQKILREHGVRHVASLAPPLDLEDDALPGVETAAPGHDPVPLPAARHDTVAPDLRIMEPPEPAVSAPPPDAPATDAPPDAPNEEPQHSPTRAEETEAAEPPEVTVPTDTPATPQVPTPAEASPGKSGAHAPDSEPSDPTRGAEGRETAPAGPSELFVDLFDAAAEPGSPHAPALTETSHADRPRPPDDPPSRPLPGTALRQLESPLSDEQMAALRAVHHRIAALHARMSKADGLPGR